MKTLILLLARLFARRPVIAHEGDTLLIDVPQGMSAELADILSRRAIDMGFHVSFLSGGMRVVGAVAKKR